MIKALLTVSRVCHVYCKTKIPTLLIGNEGIIDFETKNKWPFCSLSAKHAYCYDRMYVNNIIITNNENIFKRCEQIYIIL